MTRVRVALILLAAGAPAALPAQEPVAAEPLAVRAAPAPRWRAQGGGGVRYAVPMTTMAGYLGHGRGLAASLRAVRPRGPLHVTADAEYLHFDDRTVYRPYNGTGPAVAITSAADIMLLGAGPALAWRSRRLDATLGAGAGAGYTHSAARTAIGTSPQNQRGNTYTTLTWQVQAGAAIGLRLGAAAGAPRVGFSGRVVQLGTTKFLREYNLPVGQISGLYAKPTPYAPTIAVFALTLTAAL